MPRRTQPRGTMSRSGSPRVPQESETPGGGVFDAIQNFFAALKSVFEGTIEEGEEREVISEEGDEGSANYQGRLVSASASGGYTRAVSSYRKRSRPDGPPPSA